MKDFPLLIQVKDGRLFTVCAVEDLPTNGVYFTVVEYNTPTVAHPVWR